MGLHTMTDKIFLAILAACAVGVILLAPEKETDPLIRALEEAQKDG